MPPEYFVLTLDCSDPELLIEFWCGAVGYKLTGSAGQYTALDDPAGRLPRLLLQRVNEPKVVKNRFHLDLHVHDVDAEAARIERLGARRLVRHEEHGTSWVTMSDPEGNEFCVCPARGAPDLRPPAAGGR